MRRDENKIKIHKLKEPFIYRVVIIGGGFAGIRAALVLLKKTENVYVILIDKNHYHSYHPDYYEAACAVFKEFKETSISQFINLRQTIAIPFETIFRGRKNIQIIKDEIGDIDFEKSKILTLHKKEVKYDWLIVAAGSQTSFYDIPRLKELSYELKTIQDALNIRNGIDELFERKGKREKISVIIGGGGFTGCELAGEIMGYIKNLAKIHNHPRENIEIKIIEASPALLGGASEWAREKTKKRLNNLGVKILLNSQIEKVSKNSDYDFSKPSFIGSVHLKNRESLNFDILVWTAGVEAADISKIFPKESLEKKLCLNTDNYLSARPFKNVFAVGDIAYCFDETTKNPLPMTAQTAISQGRYAARAIIKKINKQTLKPYQPKQSQFIIPLGGKYALADLKIIKFSGFFAWALKHLVTLRYFLSILPFFSALSLWLRGLRIYIKND